MTDTAIADTGEAASLVTEINSVTDWSQDDLAHPGYVLTGEDDSPGPKAYYIHLEAKPGQEDALQSFLRDINTGVDQKPLPFIGGALSTGGGLVFYGTYSGDLKAADAKTGDLLWHFNTGSGVSQGPITYKVDGKQYVAAVSGRILGPPSFAGLLGEKTIGNTPQGGTLFVFQVPSP